MLALATADASSPFERRVALLFSAHYGRCNPLALWPSLLRDDPRFAELFRRRIDASEAIGQLVDYVRLSSHRWGAIVGPDPPKPRFSSKRGKVAWKS